VKFVPFLFNRTTNQNIVMIAKKKVEDVGVLNVDQGRKMNTPNVKEIIQLWLKENEYNGLYNDSIGYECTLEDFAPCSDVLCDCQADKVDSGNDKHSTSL
jgi:hypothetical protein